MYETEEEEIKDNRQYTPTVGVYNVGNIPLETAFLLVYSSVGSGQIVKIEELGLPPKIFVDGKQFMADDSRRELARWQEALDRLIDWGWIKSVGIQGEIFELTGTGYDKADWLKEEMQIDTDTEPLEEIKGFI